MSTEDTPETTLATETPATSNELQKAIAPVTEETTAPPPSEINTLTTVHESNADEASPPEADYVYDRRSQEAIDSLREMELGDGTDDPSLIFPSLCQVHGDKLRSRLNIGLLRKEKETRKGGGSYRKVYETQRSENVVGEVFAVGQEGNGGAPAVYHLVTRNKKTGAELTVRLDFQQNNMEDGLNGILEDLLLATIVDRADHFNDTYPVKEEHSTLPGCLQAMGAIWERQNDRLGRGVQGTQEK